jgi:FAD dependent oxidoreductase
MGIERRDFLKISSLAGGCLVLSKSELLAATFNEDGKEKTSESQSGPIPAPLTRTDRKRPLITGHYELVVVGGGLSGTCTAISAARNGVKVALVHDRPMLGGNSSSEVRLVPEFNSLFCPWARETGIIEEFYAVDRRRNHEPWIEGTANLQWDLVLFEAVKREPNITLLLNTYVRDVVMQDDKNIKAIEGCQLDTEKDFLISGDLFVDASGTGALGYFAGAEFYWGREGRAAFNEPLQPEKPDDGTMGSTMYFRSRDVQRPVKFEPPEWAAKFETEAQLGPLRSHMWIEAGYYWLEVGYPHHAIFDNDKIREEQLRQTLGVWDHIKNRGEHGAENYAIEWINWVPYRRENRRLLGDHILTQHDIQKAPVFDDRVAFGSWPIDIHTIGAMLKAPAPTLDDPRVFFEGVNPYSIPYRSLYSRNIDNLFMVGRPISCTFIAFASTRILPTGAMMGQAVGAAASICKKYTLKPRALTTRHIPELQQLLIKQDQYIPQVGNSDPNDLARVGTVTASSEATLEFPEPNDQLELTVPAAQLFPVTSDHIDRIELQLQSKASTKLRIKLGLRAAKTIWDFSSLTDLATAEADISPGETSWVAFDLNIKVKPGALYWIYAEGAKGVFWKAYVDHRDIYRYATNPEKKGWWETMRDLRLETAQVPPGTMAGKRFDLEIGSHFGGRPWNYILQPGRAHAACLAIRLTPKSEPYRPANIINGVSRPEAWTNIWISNPGVSLPQWAEFEFREGTFNKVYLTFDTDLSFHPEFPLHVVPECVRDYTLSCWVNGAWRTLVEIKDNYQRRRIHQFESVRSGKVRLTVNATNGAPSARIYEVRIYNE